MHACKINGILADEMGLGKTLQTIALIAQLQMQEEGPPHIIIVPKSTLANWQKEFARWCPALSVFQFYGQLAQRELLRSKVARTNTYHVLLTTYETAITEKSMLKAVKWSYLVIDEAHRIKNEKSVLSQIVRLFSTRHRLLITGTPLQNNLHELWALLNFLMPQVFNSAEDFDEWFDLSEGNAQTQSFLVFQLHKILKPFMLRRLKREVETQLPPKKELYVFLGMTELQRQLYRDILTKNIEIVNGLGERSQLMNTIMQLRKVCNHPYLFDSIEPGPPYIDGEHLVQSCTKFMFLDKLLPKLLEKGSKVLIFSQMTRLLDILDDFLNYRNYRFFRLDGNTHYLKREEQIEAFQTPGSPVHIFLLTTRAGGLGINLNAANTVIIYDSDWNPQADIQAMDRTHRIGQTKVVTVYRFVTKDSVEEKISERAARKLKIDHLVIQKGQLASKNKGPSVQEMNSIVSFGAQQVLRSSGDEVTPGDIDKILQYAEEKTQALSEELGKLEDAFDLNELSLDTSNFYEFEGNNYKNVKKEYISIGPRNRKATGFYDAEKLSGQQKAKKKDWRYLVGGGYPHQFFNSAELDRLQAKEEAWNEYLNTKGKKRRTDDSSVKPEKFNEKDREVKRQLLAQGMAHWTKKEFNLFIKACELYGKGSHQDIAEEIESKNEFEVKEYSALFWALYPQLQNGTDLVRKIETGERERAKLAKIEKILDQQRRSLESNSDSESLDYSADPQEAQYSRCEDQFLLQSLFEEGYGNWDSLRYQIKSLPAFRFNFWFQSKSEEEIQGRADYLISLIERQQSGHSREKRKRSDAERPPGPSVEVTAELDWLITLPHFQVFNC